MNAKCPYCLVEQSSLSDSRPIVRNGYFLRKSDGQLIQKFRCRDCNRDFSDATFSLCVNQNKRHVNSALANLLCSGVSQRRLAMLYGLSRTTVARKLVFMGTHIRNSFDRIADTARSRVVHMQFDDLETFEHSKLKPLSVTIAVEATTRKILGFEVSSMPAKGKLAKLSREKYGQRADGRKQARARLFQKISKLVLETALIRSDMNPHYGPDVKAFFPNAIHKPTKGQRGCVTGQGELKSGGYDPIFSLNHTYASARANMNRLFRRTWCTTKKSERLELHLALYAAFHNSFLTP